MSNSKENKIPILSFFSGGGFMDMGFEQAGFEVIWTNEFDKDFVELSRYGREKWKKSLNQTDNCFVNQSSISDLDTSELLIEAFGNKEIPPFGIIGGPPCQDFSLNGKMRGFNGDRGKLTIDFVNKVKILDPIFFLIENVPGLIRNQSNKEYYFILLDELKSSYLIDMKILNSLDFGVPQSRERLFTVGLKKNFFKDDGISFKWPVSESNIRNPLKNLQWPRQNNFGEFLNKPEHIPIELCVASCLVDDTDFEKIPNSNEFFQLKTSIEKLSSIKEGETNRPSFKRLHRYRYSPTTCYGNNEVHLHPFKNRRISVREALRIQGVPDTYILKQSDSLSKKFKMIGNGVPVPLARAIGNSIYEYILQNINVTAK
jgi:DNA (cytosine-5)-methyltransferase 1